MDQERDETSSLNYKLAYTEVRDRLLDAARERGFEEEFGESYLAPGELPVGFSSQNYSVSFSNTKLCQIMRMGNLDQLIELIDDPELLNSYFEEMFNTEKESYAELQKPFEDEEYREAA